MHTNYKRIVFFTFIYVTTLFANNTDFLTTYRTEGIKNIAKMFDKELAHENYWKDYLKNIDTSFGYYESNKDILACDKSKFTLSLYQKEKNHFKLIKEYSAFTGKNKGDKITEGDLRTPIGVYNLVQKLTHVDPFYGPMAFVTSYPNIYDQYKGKTGQGIWIHGVPKDQKRDSFTKGCIAINNKNLESLDQKIDISKTVLIINNKSLSKKDLKKSLAHLLADLYAWRYAWIYNNLNDYLAFYAPEFKRFDGMDLTQFKKYKTRIFAKREKKHIRFTNINIIPYPHTKNIYKITFHENYRTNSFTFNGDKVLIAKLTNDKLQIITEK
jgi:murein L,D-transpeptidase YafK